MIGLAIFCLQIIFVQYTFSQTVATPATINNQIPNVFGPNPGIGPQAIAGSNIGQPAPGIPGPNIGLAGPNIGLAGPGLVRPNIGLAGAGLPGPNIGFAGPGYPGKLQLGALGPLGANQALGLMGVPSGITGNPMGGYAANYGGNGNGNVGVAGELPVVGTTAITGNVPLTGKVAFAGNIPAGGTVVISGQCNCGCNGPHNAPYGVKPVHNNKPYLF